MNPILERARDGECLADLDIVDLHGHVGRYLFPIEDLSAAGLLRVMDRLGVKKLFLSHIQCEAMLAREGNDDVLAIIRAHPDRFMGYAILFPTSEAEVTAEMKRCLAAGFIGLKLENINGQSYLNPAYDGAYALANERRLPILLHTWGGANNEFAEIRELTLRYPDSPFLLAHAGAGGSADLYIALAHERENTYLDLALSGSPPDLVERLVAGVGADRVTYGSDCYFLSMPYAIGKVFGARIPDQDKLKILSGNARQILNGIRR
jgi:predicted TIM-barrel fold metal-dependent hydrolase